MSFGRLVNAIACRTYAVLWGLLTASYLMMSIGSAWLGHAGVPKTMFGQPVEMDATAEKALTPGALYAFAAVVLVAAVICAVLAAFTWRRSIIAVGISFALWAFVIGVQFGSLPHGHSAHPIIEAFVILGFGALLAAAIATRRQARLPAAA